METIYYISGLGADKRAYEKLIFPENYTIRHIDWKVPFKNETLNDYSNRLVLDLDVENNTLIGLSFGGIVAQFIANQIPCKKIILISSVKSPSGIPKIRKILRILPFYKILPKVFFRKTNFIVNWLFGIKNTEGKELLQSIFELSDYRFVLWAIKQIVWVKEFPKIDTPIYQIHGSSDKLFPIALQNPDFIIPKGGHFMIYEDYENVSEILEIILKKNNLNS